MFIFKLTDAQEEDSLVQRKFGFHPKKMFDETVNPFIIIFHDKLKEEPVENVDHDYSSHERIANFFMALENLEDADAEF